MKIPKTGETFTVKISRVSSSGNGIISGGKKHINIGPVREDSQSKKIKATMIRSNFAYCHTKSVRAEGYNQSMMSLVHPHESDNNIGFTDVDGCILLVRPTQWSQTGLSNQPATHFAGKEIIIRNATLHDEVKIKIKSEGKSAAIAEIIDHNPEETLPPDTETKFLSGQIELSDDNILQYFGISSSDSPTELSSNENTIQTKDADLVQPISAFQFLSAIECDQLVYFCINCRSVILSESTKRCELCQSDGRDKIQNAGENDTASNSINSSNFQDKQDDSDIAELRDKAMRDAVEEITNSNDKQHDSSTSPYTRSQSVSNYVKARANGSCEGCGDAAPFMSKTGEPYLHAHHIYELTDGGADTPDTVIALCPNCHYRVHHGKDGEEYNEKLLQKVQNIEN